MTETNATPQRSPANEEQEISGSVLWPIALAILIDVASGRSQVASPLTFQQSDKVVHFFIFGLLGTLILRSGPVWRREGKRWWIPIVAVSLYGIVDEFRQSFTPGRSVELADWMMDTLGASTAVCAYLLWGGYRRLLEMPLWTSRRNLASNETTETEKGER